MHDLFRGEYVAGHFCLTLGRALTLLYAANRASEKPPGSARIMWVSEDLRCGIVCSEGATKMLSGQIGSLLEHQDPENDSHLSRLVTIDPAIGVGLYGSKLAYHSQGLHRKCSIHLLDDLRFAFLGQQWQRSEK